MNYVKSKKSSDKIGEEFYFGTVNSYSTYSTENSGISIVMQGALKKSCFPVKPFCTALSFAEPPHCFVLIEKECMGGHGSSIFREKRVPL